MSSEAVEVAAKPTLKQRLQVLMADFGKVAIYTYLALSLGPIAATTGVSALPAERPGGEVQAAVMPVFFLSDATQQDKAPPRADPQLSALFEPDRLFGTKGLILGLRTWGEE